MALGRAFAVAIRGLDGITVEIEADITGGLPGVHLVGLPDTALQESRDRVRAAITNCGNTWPDTRLTLALSPATLPKVGSMYDLALASAVLSAHLKTSWARLEKTVLLGELALDGRVRPVKGVLPAVLAAKRDGWQAVVVPLDNLAEASLVDGIDVWGVQTLRQLQDWFRGKGQLAGRVTDAAPYVPPECRDLADLIGQTAARVAVEVAAAGAHHLMLTGPPSRWRRTRQNIIVTVSLTMYGTWFTASNHHSASWAKRAQALASRTDATLKTCESLTFKGTSLARVVLAALVAMSNPLFIDLHYAPKPVVKQWLSCLNGAQYEPSGSSYRRLRVKEV